MSHPRFFSLAVPAVAAAVLLFAGGAWAGGHGGGGGGHGGGGGGHGGGAVRGGGAYRGGYGGGYYNRGYGGGYGYGGGLYLGLGLGYPGYGYGYGGYDGGYAPDYYPPSYAAPPASYYVAPPAAPTPSIYSVPNAPALGGPASQDPIAHVLVKVPADAEVWFGQGKTQQTGAQREFVSPPLTPGKDYSYEVKARWTEGGKEVTQTRTVDVSAGAWKTIDFTKPTPEQLEPPKPKP